MPYISKTDEFSEKVPKGGRGGGGGVIFNPIYLYCIFLAIISCSLVMNSGKNLQYDFPKMRGGCWIKGRLELFRKFFCFGVVGLP